MKVGGLWRRFKDWYRQEKETYLYYVTPEVMARTAPPPFPGLRILSCDRHNLNEVSAAIPNFPASIEERVLQGDLAILAATDAEWIFRSTAILGPKTHLVDGYPLELTAAGAFMQYAETIPTWRGKGVAPGMLGPTARELTARGICDVYLSVVVTNTASCKAIEKGGGKRVGHIISRRRFGRWTASFEPISRVAATD